MQDEMQELIMHKYAGYLQALPSAQLSELDGAWASKFRAAVTSTRCTPAHLALVELLVVSLEAEEKAARARHGGAVASAIGGAAGAGGGGAGLDMSSVARLYEYSSAAAVQLPVQPAVAFPSSLHSGPEPSAVVHLDLSAALGSTPTPATSPNLLASFLRLQPGAPVATTALCSSQLFYVIRGQGRTTGSSFGDIVWSAGDTFTLPGTDGGLTHCAGSASSAALYWVHDEPLLRYLGVAPSFPPRFTPALYTDKMLKDRVEEVSHEAGAEGRNRKGVLMGHEVTEAETRTATPVLWALLNTLPPHTAQPPHRHNSVALDLCVDAAPGGGVYTVMGPRLGEDGWVHPEGMIKMQWQAGAVFTTPPGWWHSHHNETSQPALVLPVQDAGLLTRQRVLDIQFSPAAPKTV